MQKKEGGIYDLSVDLHGMVGNIDLLLTLYGLGLNTNHDYSHQNELSFSFQKKDVRTDTLRSVEDFVTRIFCDLLIKIDEGNENHLHIDFLTTKM